MSHRAADVIPSAPAADPTATAPRPGRYLVLAVLSAIFVANFLDRQILAILTEPIKAELRLSDTRMGLLSGFAFALFYTTFAIPLAWVADRSNRVRIVAAACAVWSLFTVACGFAGSYLQLLAFRIGVGVGEAGGSPPSHALISEYFPPAERGRALAVYSLGVALGPALAAGVGGAVAAHYGWRAAFIVVGAPGVLLAILTLLLIREPGRTPRPAGTDDLAGAVVEFARHPVLRNTALAAGFGAFVAYAVSAWAPAYLMRTRGMSLGELSVYYALTSAVAATLGTLASGLLADRLGRISRRAVSLLPAVAYLIAAPLLAAATLAPTWIGALVLLGLCSVLLSVFLAPALALVQNVAPPHRRALSGALTLFCLNLIGLGGGPLFVGLVSDLAAPRYGAGSLAIALAALVPVALLAAAFNGLAARASGATPMAPVAANGP